MTDRTVPESSSLATPSGENLFGNRQTPADGPDLVKALAEYFAPPSSVSEEPRAPHEVMGSELAMLVARGVMRAQHLQPEGALYGSESAQSHDDPAGTPNTTHAQAELDQRQARLKELEIAERDSIRYFTALRTSLRQEYIRSFMACHPREVSRVVERHSKQIDALEKQFELALARASQERNEIMTWRMSDETHGRTPRVYQRIWRVIWAHRGSVRERQR